MYSPSSLVLSNFLWFIFGGFIIFIEYLLVGFVFILTVFLFRSGVQIWKLALLVVAPLNRNWSSIVDKSPSGPFPNGFMWTCRLIIWIPFMVLIFMTHVAFMIVLVCLYMLVFAMLDDFDCRSSVGTFALENVHFDIVSCCY